MRAVLALSFVLSSCSLFGEPRASLSLIWSISSVDSDTFILETLGGIGGGTFYSYRGRRNDVRQLVGHRLVDGHETFRAGVLGVCGPPISTPGRLFCPAARLYAFDTATGRLLWSFEPSDRLDLIQGSADASRVYAGTSDFNGRTTEAFAADAATGEILWRRQFSGEGWIGVRLRSLTLSPEGDLLAAVVSIFPPLGGISNAAAVIALDPATGAERWRYQDGDATTYRNIGGLTMFEDLVLYNDNTAQEAVAFSRTTREVVWRAPWTPTFVGTLRPPQVADGVAYFADGAAATFAVDARTGRHRWRTDLEGGAYSLEVCGPVVLMNNGPVEVLDRATGRPRGRLLADDDEAGQMAVADDVAYISAESGVYAFDCSTLGR